VNNVRGEGAKKVILISWPELGGGHLRLSGRKRRFVGKRQ